MCLQCCSTFLICSVKPSFFRANGNCGIADWGGWGSSVGDTFFGLWDKAKTVAADAAASIQDQDVIQKMKIAASTSAVWVGDKSRSAVDAVQVGRYC